MRLCVVERQRSPVDLASFRKEDGSLTVFGLFLFILILFISGMAVDLVRAENERVAVQNALDTAIIAASSLDSTLNTEAEVKNLVKQYVAKAGYDGNMVDVTPDISMIGNNAISRSVSASSNFNVDTMFMNMMGIDSLGSSAGGMAREGRQLIEIVLVLDISGSMETNGKLANLQAAAKEFVTTVLSNNSPERTMISIVPYNHHVYMDNELMSRLTLANQTVTVADATGGEISSYQTLNPASRCTRFHPGDFQTRRLAATADVDMSASYVDNRFYWALNGVTNTQYEQPLEFSFWCGSHYAPILLFQNNETVLHDYIDDFYPLGGTAIDYGMNWAVGILDASFAPVIQDMVDDGVVPDAATGHPVAFGTPDVLKYIVLMTDGENTNRLDLKDEYKSGPSRIWYSDALAASGNEFNGYIVNMPDNDATQRWYVPGSPHTSSDDYYLDDISLPSDAVQWDYHQVFRRFRVGDMADYFFQYSDPAAQTEFQDALVDVGGFGTADTNLQNICDLATQSGVIEVFTVSFEATAHGAKQLRDCVSKPGNAFDVAGTQISAAFSSIAAQISTLRLME